MEPHFVVFCNYDRSDASLAAITTTSLIAKTGNSVSLISKSPVRQPFSLLWDNKVRRFPRAYDKNVTHAFYFGHSSYAISQINSISKNKRVSHIVFAGCNDLKSLVPIYSLIVTPAVSSIPSLFLKSQNFTINNIRLFCLSWPSLITADTNFERDHNAEAVFIDRETTKLPFGDLANLIDGLSTDFYRPNIIRWGRWPLKMQNLIKEIGLTITAPQTVEELSHTFMSYTRVIFPRLRWAYAAFPSLAAGCGAMPILWRGLWGTRKSCNWGYTQKPKTIDMLPLIKKTREYRYFYGRPDIVDHNDFLDTLGAAICSET